MSATYSAAELKNKNIEWLLSKRALGPKINEETHARIAAEIINNGCILPPIPKFPIQTTGSSTFVIAIVALSFVIFFITINTILFVFGFRGAIYYAIAYFIGFWLFSKFNGYIQSALRMPPNNLPADARSALRKGIAKGVTELMITAAVGDIERVKDLINYGADVNAVTNNGLTALMYAAASGQSDSYRLLLQNHADPAAKSKNGMTAIEIGLKNGHDAL